MSVARPPSKKPTVIERVMAWEQAYLAVADRLKRDIDPHEPWPDGAILGKAADVAIELIKGTEEAG